jgi:hypothetical protein
LATTGISPVSSSVALTSSSKSSSTSGSTIGGFAAPFVGFDGAPRAPERLMADSSVPR